MYYFMELLICYIRMFCEQAFGIRLAIDRYFPVEQKLPGKSLKGLILSGISP